VRRPPRLRLAWASEPRPPERPDPLWFTVALNLILLTMTVELLVVARLLLKLR